MNTKNNDRFNLVKIETSHTFKNTEISWGFVAPAVLSDKVGDIGGFNGSEFSDMASQ